MKQLLQNIRDGKAVVADVPIPAVRRGMALVHTSASLVSAGTERMVVDFAGKSLVGKAASRPDLVRQLLDKARREGIFTALESAFNKLDQPMALGYSSAGTIIAVGDGMSDFHPGDRVACGGGGFAAHAEYALVPRNLLVKIPPQVDFESAAFTTLGAIAMQGFRLAQPQVGERIAVIGLGLLGLLTVSIANAAGCSVFGIDLDPRRIELAEKLGAKAILRTEAETAGKAFTCGRGFDAVLICADAKTNDPVNLAGLLARDRAAVVAVGAVGLNLPRKIYYEKELNFIVSRSYGPGRYDPAYEEGGQDYPIGYVRWTEGRNLESIVDLLASGKMNVQPLITHRFPIEKGADAYAVITGKTGEPSLGVLLTYPQGEVFSGSSRASNPLASIHARPQDGAPGLGVLGSGNYATAVFLPIVRKSGGIARVGIVSAAGLTARNAALKFDFGYASSSEDELLADERVNALAVLTRHNQHSRQILAGLRSGKAVFCEKPLAIHQSELDEIAEEIAKDHAPLLMVGFNRRFSPFARQMKAFFGEESEPLAIHYRVNAGYLPDTHWLHDMNIGGGRIIGEGCHFVDFLTYLIGKPPVSVRTQGLPDAGRYHEDNVVMTFTFADGSLGTISYLANGEKSFPKERVEVFGAGKVGVLDDFRSLELVREGQRVVKRSLLRQDKGHQDGWQAFLQASQTGGQPPIPYDHLIGVTRATFAAVESLRLSKEMPIE